MNGQIDIFEYLASLPDVSGLCKPCICNRCLYWWSDRCPNGHCFDDKRAVDDPYDKAHPDKPPRNAWSDWNKPGEQAYWCRGGIFYPTYRCSHFERYTGVKIEACIQCNITVYQDGYMFCPLVDNIGCEACYGSMMSALEDAEVEP